jgi:hypothetical protein
MRMHTRYFDIKTWTTRRWIYLATGLFLTVLAIVEKEGLGALIGAYFMIMAVFNVGCASGCCSNDSCTVNYTQKNINNNVKEK